MSSTSVFFLKQQKGFKSMGPYEFNFTFFFEQNRIQMVGPDEFNCSLLWTKRIFSLLIIEIERKVVPY